MKKIKKPSDIHYAVYYEPFIKLVQDDVLVLKQLKENSKTISKIILSLTEEQLLYKYETYKWCIKDIVQHLIDVERIFINRATRFARNDKSPQPFFNENDFADEALASKINVKKLVKDYTNCRQSTISFFENLTPKMLERVGVASNSAMSVGACAWIICGHELHHFNVIKEKYLIS
jgi:uncharacterized damage-inducible protein DinB